MNLATILVLVIPITILIWGSVQCHREAKHFEPKESQRWKYGSWALFGFAIILISAIIVSQMDIPNPLAPAPTESLPAFGFSRDIDDKLTVPATNADPAKAADDNRKLLEEVRRQQH